MKPDRLFLLALMVSMAPFAWGQTPEENQAPDQPTSAEESQSPARPMVTTGLGAEVIARNHPDRVVWLSPAEQPRTLSLFQPERESPAKGALIIVSDEGVSAASGVARAIQEPLSKAGWAVMSLGLDLPPLGVRQWLDRQSNNPGAADAQSGGSGDDGSGANENTDDSNNEQAEESSVMINVMDNVTPSEAVSAYRDRVTSAITAAFDALQEREYDRIVLAGIGRAAGHVTRQARQDGRASDLIWIAPHFYPDESRGLTQLLESAASPSVLELYSTFPGEATADRSAAERAAALKRAGISGYQRQPVAMARRPQPREAHALSNRIAAWLRSTQKK